MAARANPLQQLLGDQIALLRIGAPLALAAAVLDGSFGFFTVVIQSLLPDQLNGGAQSAGFALALYGLSRVLLQTPGGMVARRLGAWRVLFAGLLAAGIALLALAGVSSLPIAYLLVLAYGAATAIAWPAVYLHAGELEQERRGELFGIITFCSLGAAAAGLGLGALLVDLVSPRLLLVCLAGGVAAGLLAASALGRISGDGAQPQPRTATLNQPVRVSLWFLLAALIFQGLGLSILLPLVRELAHTQLQLQMQDLVVLAIPAGVTGAIGLFAAGRAADRFGRAPVVAAGGMLAALGVIALAMAHDGDGFALAALLIAPGYAACAAALGAWLTDVGAESGALVGMSLTVQGISFAIGPALTGFMLASNQLGGALLLAAVAWLLAGLVAAAGARAAMQVQPEQGVL